MKCMKKLLSMVLISMLMITMAVPMETSAATKLMVHYIDVGQGDAILIQYGSKNTLIDAGEEKNYSKLNSYLKKIKVKKVHNLIVTHPDSDHIGGADYVIRDYKVSKIYMTKFKSKSSEYKEMIAAIKKHKVERTNVTVGMKIGLGGIKATVLHAKNSGTDANESSIVLKLKHNKKSFLFTGDISAEIEKQIAKKYNVNVDVLKVSHHGSSYSSAVSFVKETSPEYAVISVGKDNNYGHPVKTVLNRLKKYSNKVLRTDKNGTVVVTSTGTKLSYKTVATQTSGSSSSSSGSSSSGSSSSGSSSSGSSSSLPTVPTNGSTTVYITATGSKYHRQECGNGNYSKTTLKTALSKKLEPCSKCYNVK